jgi:hypothetical protein
MSIAAQQALDAKANALTSYVNNQVAAATIADADATTKGKIQLAGDLGGTASSPQVLAVGGILKDDIAAGINLMNAATGVSRSARICVQTGTTV